MGGKSYPIPIRVLSFEGRYEALDPHYDQAGAETAAVELRSRFGSSLATARRSAAAGATPAAEAEPTALPHKEEETGEVQDTLATYEASTLGAFEKDEDLLRRLRTTGVPWRGVQESLKGHLPDLLSDRDEMAYSLVPKAMKALFGEQGVGWKTEKRPARSGLQDTTWVVVIEGRAP